LYLEKRKNKVSQDLKHDNTKNTEEKKTSRRSLMLGVAAVAFGISTILKPKKAMATPDDVGVLTDIDTWLKTTYATNIAPTLKTIIDGYKMAKDWVNDWNKFVSNFNTVMKYSQDVRDFCVEKRDNWFYQTYEQTKLYINDMLKTDGDILNYRLKYYDPILIAKIDSFINQSENLLNRGLKIAEKYVQTGKNINESDPLRSTNEGKMVIRSSNDHAKYLEASTRVLALKQTLNKINLKMDLINSNNTSPNHSGDIYNGLASPVHSQMMLLQCSLLSEIYQKLNDISLITAKEVPIVADGEKFVTASDIKEVINSLGKSRDQDKKEGFLL